jgi:hypothetical protein
MLRGIEIYEVMFLILMSIIVFVVSYFSYVSFRLSRIKASFFPEVHSQILTVSLPSTVFALFDGAVIWLAGWVGFMFIDEWSYLTTTVYFCPLVIRGIIQWKTAEEITALARELKSKS